MKTVYSILPKHFDDWGASWSEHMVYDSDIESAARGWGVSIGYVRDTVKVFSPSDYIGEVYDDPESTFQVIDLANGLFYTVMDVQEDSPNFGKEYLVPFEEVEYYIEYA